MRVHESVSPSELLEPKSRTDDEELSNVLQTAPMQMMDHHYIIAGWTFSARSRHDSSHGREIKFFHSFEVKSSNLPTGPSLHASGTSISSSLRLAATAHL